MSTHILKSPALFIPRVCALLACLVTTQAHAAYVNTGWLSNLSIHMDNGRTYFSGFTVSGNCLYDRIELRDSGDYFNSAENGRRMYALILAARMADKQIKLGYDDADGPTCRLAEVWINW